MIPIDASNRSRIAYSKDLALTAVFSSMVSSSTPISMLENNIYNHTTPTPRRTECSKFITSPRVIRAQPSSISFFPRGVSSP